MGIKAGNALHQAPFTTYSTLARQAMVLRRGRGAAGFAPEQTARAGSISSYARGLRPSPSTLGRQCGLAWRGTAG